MEETAPGAASPPPPPASGAAERGRRSRKKLVLWMSAALAFFIILAALLGGVHAWRFKKAAGELTLGEVDTSGLADGVYAGSYELFHVKAAVEVEVEGGRIASILFTDSGRMSEEAQRDIEEIFAAVTAAQSLDVDIASGATVSKKVSLKAVEEALAKAGSP